MKFDTLPQTCLALAAGSAREDSFDWYFIPLKDAAYASEASIRVEKINGPVLRITGIDDKLWPSTELTQFAVERFQHDGEHAPNDVRSTLAQLQAVAAYPGQPVVRAASGDTALIKQLLDIGAQNLLVPMVDTAAQARARWSRPRAIRRRACAASALPWHGPRAGTQVPRARRHLRGSRHRRHAARAGCAPPGRGVRPRHRERDERRRGIRLLSIAARGAHQGARDSLKTRRASVERCSSEAPS